MRQVRIATLMILTCVVGVALAILRANFVLGLWFFSVLMLAVFWKPRWKPVTTRSGQGPRRRPAGFRSPFFLIAAVVASASLVVVFVFGGMRIAGSLVSWMIDRIRYGRTRGVAD
jgi:hypothetical protein